MTAVEVAGGVHLAAAPADEALAALPVPEWATREARGLAPRRAREYLAVRALYAHLVTEVDGGPASPLARTARGAPVVPGRPGLRVSLAHSDEVVAVALGRGRAVGVDVQDAGLPGPAMLRRCCPAEAGRMTADPAAGGRDFARVWAAQEACVKATGQGIAGRPWRIPVTAAAVTGRWQDLTWTQLRGRESASALCCAFTDRTEEGR
ncbi:4'-phosphopantetheinyl transferase family protein [Amycolatopsis australiensis]|uniref:4'-phosphopantetheinyl transferase n=1 Tax=Amycolatopsis australiensis TaxID=546364 RepID=A0A1K1SAM3_9PSEU|nr:4'-phosphopantetheinyl transferase superfamily protein [Amycolatopsis australiensis]SFW81417.1 4'-phosphopantetheinyl transferase [Amycolatopsis australiensis]